MSSQDPTNPPITQRGSQPRDDNDTAITGFGCSVSSSKTLSADGTTAAVPIFSVNGSVRVLALYGVITTDLGNNTAAYWRLNDGSNQSNISLNTGTTLSSAVAGSIILRRLAATNALSLENASQERVQDPGGTGVSSFTEFIVVQAKGIETDIEFVYTTSDSPTTGAIQFFVYYLPLSQGSYLTAI